MYTCSIPVHMFSSIAFGRINSHPIASTTRSLSRSKNWGPSNRATVPTWQNLYFDPSSTAPLFVHWFCTSGSCTSVSLLVAVPPAAAKQFKNTHKRTTQHIASWFSPKKINKMSDDFVGDVDPPHKQFVAMLFTYLQHRTFDRFDPNGRTLAKQFFWFWVHEHVVVKIKRSTVQKQSVCNKNKL